MISTKRLLLVSVPLCMWQATRFYVVPLLSLITLRNFAYILLAHLFIVFIYWSLIYPKYISPFRNLPEPASRSFLLGHVPAMLKDPQGMAWRSWADDAPNHGVLRFMDALNQERLMVVSPAAVADVLVHKCYDFQKPELVRISSTKILGDGILFAESDVHKQQRKIIMPAFSFRHIKELYPMFWNRSQRMVKAIKEQGRRTDGDSDKSIVVEVNAWASKATLSIIEDAATGVDTNAIEDPLNPLALTYCGMMASNYVNMVMPLLAIYLPAWLVWNLPVGLNRALKRNDSLLSEACRKQTEQITTQTQENNPSSSTILSTLVRSQQFSATEIVEQMKTFVVAGHETTATALTWSVYLLTKYPEMQKRLREEVGALPRDNEISAADIDGLTYIHAFISEVLRFYPPVPATVREAVHDTSVTGTPVPKGTIVILAPWAMCTSKKYWGADAQVFNPDRWLKSPGGGADSNYSMLTFLHGPRSCVGERFARSEFACLLAAWVQAFETELERPDQEVKIDLTAGITVKPKGGLHVRLRPTDG